MKKIRKFLSNVFIFLTQYWCDHEVWSFEMRGEVSTRRCHDCHLIDIHEPFKHRANDGYKTIQNMAILLNKTNHSSKKRRAYDLNKDCGWYKTPPNCS